MKKLFTLVALVLAITGCTGTRTLYNLPDTPVQYVKVVLIHHNALGTEVADLRADPNVSPASKAKLLAGYRATVCAPSEKVEVALCLNGPAQQLEAAGRAYEALHNAKTEADMQKALSQLVGLLSTLINLVNGAK
jgi:hypothetical protein